MAGEDLAELDPMSNLDSESLHDPVGGWSWLRVGNLVVQYRPLTASERHARGSDGCGPLGNALVSRIISLDRYWELMLAALVRGRR